MILEAVQFAGINLIVGAIVGWLLRSRVHDGQYIKINGRWFADGKPRGLLRNQDPLVSALNNVVDVAPGRIVRVELFQ